jgi:hypothetical protein
MYKMYCKVLQKSQPRAECRTCILQRLATLSSDLEARGLDLVTRLWSGARELQSRPHQVNPPRSSLSFNIRNSSPFESRIPPSIVPHHFLTYTLLPPHFTKKEAGRAVAQLVEAWRYKPEGRGFDSWLCYWIFFYVILPVASASIRNEWRPVHRVGLTNLPPSYADCLAIWEPQTPGTLRDRDCFT